MTLVEEKSLAEPDVLENPTPYHHALHERGVWWDERLGFFITARYDVIRRVLRDVNTFSNVGSQTMDGLKPPPREVGEIRRTMQPQVDTLVTNDPPSHTRFRQMVDNPFSPKKVRQNWRASIDRIVSDTLDEFVPTAGAAGSCDFVKQFAEPVPLRVIADALGVPREDAPLFKRWSDASVAPLGMMISDEEHIECTRQVKAMQDYFMAEFDKRREQPTDDLLSHLVHVRIEGEAPLTTPEMISITQQLLVAGNETTTNALAAGMQLLIENPEQERIMREDPSRTRIFVEEILRLESPTQGLFRVVTEDTVLEGVELPRGSRIMLRYAGANRDPAQYPEPDALDVRRKNSGTNVAFGAGIHHCLGAALAREEMHSAFEHILARLQNMRFTPERNDFRHYPSMILRGLEHLWIDFEAR